MIEEEGLPQSPPPRRAERFVVTSATISILSLLDVVGGYVVDALVAARFGVGEETDALFSAHTVPSVVSNVANVLTLSLVTVLARWRVAEERHEIWKVFSPIVTWAMLIGLAVGLVGAGLSDLLVRLVTPGFDPDTLELASSLTRVAFVGLPFLMVGPLIKSFLYAHEQFALPFSASLVQNAIRFAAIYFFSRSFGIFAAAWGEVIGLVVESLVCLALLAWHHGFPYRPSLRLRHQGVQEVLHLAVAPATNTVMVRATGVVERVVASFLPVGSVTALRYSNRVVHALAQVLFGGITMSISPVLSANVAAAEMGRARQEVKRALKLAALIGIPTIVGIWLLRVPIVTVLFERGAFDERATQLTATVLGLYVLALFGVGHSRIFIRFFYASLDRRTIVSVTAISSAATVILDLTLPRVMGVSGLALGYSLGMTVAAVGAAALINRSLAGFPWGEIGLFEGKIVLASAGMALGVLLVHPWLGQALGGDGLVDAVRNLVLTVGMGAGLFGVCAWVLRIRERELLLSFLHRRLIRGRRARGRP